MTKGCKAVEIGSIKAIHCGGKPDHVCNENATVFISFNGHREIFYNAMQANAWYNDNYEYVQSVSVACSICGRAAIDDAPYL